VAGPVQIDPPRCGCTECLNGLYVPLDRATPAQVAAMLRGELDDYTGLDKAELEEGGYLMAEAAVTQDLANELRVPENAHGYRDIIESLPELVRTQAECLNTLAEDLSERGGPAVEQTVGYLHDLAKALGEAVEPAELAALKFPEEAEFWFSGDG
jgi:hypothetical protein